MRTLAKIGVELAARAGVISFVCFALLSTACNDEPHDAVLVPATTPASDANASDAAVPVTPEVLDRGDGLTVEIQRRGSGAIAHALSRVSVQYTARVAGAEQPFDSTHMQAAPLSIELSARAQPRVIEGLRRGLIGLSAGTHATIHVPAALAWGESGKPEIGVPEKSEVVFDIELLEVQ